MADEAEKLGLILDEEIRMADEDPYEVVRMAAVMEAARRYRAAIRAEKP